MKYVVGDRVRTICDLRPNSGFLCAGSVVYIKDVCEDSYVVSTERRGRRAGTVASGVDDSMLLRC
jgi:hypothetical protein